MKEYYTTSCTSRHDREKNLNKYADQALSLVDATSFALMEQLGITRAFSFDFHFRIYRKADGTNFEVLP